MDNTKIVLNLLGVETNTVLACLGKVEYVKVYDLIARIREQAAKQIEAAKPEEPNTFVIKYDLFGRDAQLIVKTLNNHPFDQIVQLTENIRDQVIPQLEAAKAEKPDGDVE